MRMHIKATVVCAFAFRLVCAVFASLHGVWIAKYVRSSDPGLAIADVLVWQQVALGYSLIATTIPTLKNFVRGYNKAMGWDPSSEKRGFGGGYNLGSLVRSGGKNSPLRSRGNSNPPRSGGSSRPRPSEGEIQLGPVVGDYRVGAFHDSTSKAKGARRDLSVASGESADPIIRRQISVTVETERAASSRGSEGMV